MTIVYCNNQSTIHLTKKQMYHQRTKHIDVTMLFIRDTIAQGAITVEKISTADNPVAMLTKPLAVNIVRTWSVCAAADALRGTELLDDIYIGTAVALWQTGCSQGNRR